jgi:hypothetical protein
MAHSMLSHRPMPGFAAVALELDAIRVGVSVALATCMLPVSVPLDHVVNSCGTAAYKL